MNVNNTGAEVMRHTYTFYIPTLTRARSERMWESLDTIVKKLATDHIEC